MTKFLLIRHATNNTVGKVLAGRTQGIHLNEEGQQQARNLVQQLAHVPIEAIYSSPLERAVETALPLAQAIKLETIVNDDFLEINFGEWNGRSFEDLNKDPQFQLFNSFRSCTRIPGGELMLEAQARIVNGIATLRKKHPTETVAIFSHADLIKAAIAYYAGIHLDMFQRIEISPASVSIISIDDYTAKIHLLNHTGEIH